MTVKMITSNYAGVPTVNTQGSLNTMLLACLVNGYNSQSTTQIANTVSAQQTMTVSSGHGFVVNQNVTVAGSAYSVYNVEGRIVAITSTTVTITNTGLTTGHASDTAGGMTIIGSPLGFTNLYSTTNKTAFRTSNTKWILHVDDTLDSAWTSSFAIYAKVTLCDAMSDINTFTGSQAPYQTSNPTKNHVASGSSYSAIPGWATWFYNASSATASNGQVSETKLWTIIGDGNRFYLIINQNNNYLPSIYFFGEFISSQPGDVYNAAIYFTNSSGVTATSAWGNGGTYSGCLFSAANNSISILKSYSGIGDSVVGLTTSLMTTGYGINNTGGSQGGPISGSSGSVISFPNPSNQGLLIHPVYLIENSQNMRGLMPGAYWNLQYLSSALSDRTIFTGLAEYPTRQFIVVRSEGQYISQNWQSSVTFDLTGPWT